MNGIIGIQGNNEKNIHIDMITKIMHRGKNQKIFSLDHNTVIGFVANDLNSIYNIENGANVFSLSKQDNSTSVALMNGRISLKRDKFGVEPLYYVILNDSKIAFASEVKALIGFGSKIYELNPGFIFEDLKLKKYYQLAKETPIDIPQDELGVLLKETLIRSIQKKLNGNKVGAWLSGGLDSSALSALVSPLVKELHTFSVGFLNAPDLQFAKMVADHIGSIHHEKIISFEDVLKVLPDVIYHLESFDALLVRSSIMNYFAAQISSEHVDEVFSGEGGDELFAGYQYIKEIPFANIEDELIDITQRLHNTALQRVDRCSSAFGVTAHVPFLDEDVVELALRIPVKYKLRDDVEKWILRLAIVNHLPTDALMRTKSKFWEGSGMGEHLYSYSEGFVTDSEFLSEKKIKCGWELNSKEELLYYRIFREHFGDLENLNWMGRSKIFTPFSELNKR